ncbi:MAG: UTP--glucose-1-phosphate uridylyltransferase [Paracoccaceae bacterium]|nr:UTP--glucose-1-phosphate uridylyltransferase [Paracoccaceae bacterium]
MKPVRKAVFPVAGLGTRFLPATKSVPKEMLPLIDRPLIQYAIDEAHAAGIEEFIFITSSGKGALENYFSEMPELEQKLAQKGNSNALAALQHSNLAAGAACFIRQDQPKGLGHAVSLARHAVGDAAFAVILPDDVIRAATPALAQMMRAVDGSGRHMVATQPVAEKNLSTYGVVDIRQKTGAIQHLRGLVEKPAPGTAPSHYGIVGRYILQPSIFDRLATVAPGAGGEIQLTDAIAAELDETGVDGYVFDGQRFDCGSVRGHLEATMAFAQDRRDLDGLFASETTCLTHAA